MICEYCPLSDPEDVCPESEGKYGYETSDGRLGCKHPRNWVEKRDNDHTNAIGDMGLDMGIEMDLSTEELSRAIAICEHMVGLDYKRPYHRHGKAFYRPYRNYYADTLHGNRILDKLPSNVVQKEVGRISTWYTLTNSGMAWLGRQLHVTILNEKKGRRSNGTTDI